MKSNMLSQTLELNDRLAVTARTATPSAVYTHAVGERNSERPRPQKSTFVLGSITDVNEKIVKLQKFLYGSASTATSSTRSSEFTGGIDFSFSAFDDDPLLPERNRQKAKEKADLNQFAGLFAITAAMKFRKSTTPTPTATPLRADVAASLPKRSGSGAKSKMSQLPLYADTHKFEYHSGMIPLANGLKPEQIYSQVLLSDRKSGTMSDSEATELVKLLHSPPCISLLLDSFWWIFVDTYADDYTKKTSLSPLFDRVAQHYLHFLQFCNAEINKNVFKIIANRSYGILKNFPEILSKAVYCAFCNCFPDSVKQYSDAFRNCIVNIVFEWICGAKPRPDMWKTWNLAMLEKSALKVTRPTDFDVDADSKTHRSRNSRQSTIVADLKPNKKSVSSTPLRSFSDKNSSKMTVPNSELLTEITEEDEAVLSQLRNEERQDEFDEFMESVNRACVLKQPKQKAVENKLDQPSASTLDTRKQGPRKSYPVIKGGYTSTVQFNLNARSPLLEHCVRMKKLTIPDAGFDLLVHRAEARQLPSEQEMFTYHDVVTTVRDTTKKIREDYDVKHHVEEAERLKFLASVKENVAYREEQVKSLLANQREVSRLCNLIVVEHKRNDPSEVATAGVSADEQLEAALRRQKSRHNPA